VISSLKMPEPGCRNNWRDYLKSKGLPECCLPTVREAAGDLFPDWTKGCDHSNTEEDHCRDDDTHRFLGHFFAPDQHPSD
jgi:hypothetical protein